MNILFSIFVVHEESILNFDHDEAPVWEPVKQEKKLDAQGIEPWTLYNSDANAKHTRYHCAKRPFFTIRHVTLEVIFSPNMRERNIRLWCSIVYRA